MIQIPRVLARQFLAVLRKSVPVGTPRRQRLSLDLHASGNGLSVRAQHLDVALEYHLAGTHPPDRIILPAEALADLEGRNNVLVTLENTGETTVQARWDDAGLPQVHDYQTIDPGNLPSFPMPPEKAASLEPIFLKALADAVQTTARDGTRYALTRLHLKGSRGELVATDGHQLLIQGGFTFPWTEDILVPAVAVFGCRELPRDVPVTIGKSESHVGIRVGPWTIFLAIDKDGRFPRVENIIPSANGPGTVCRLSAEDAAFLLRALQRLPGRDDQHGPVTIDLNGHVAVRARAEGQGKVTEVVLSRSHVSSKPVRFVSNRNYLARMVQLGFLGFCVTSPDKPVVCREKDRVYLWMTLNDANALAPSEDMLRISSAGESQAAHEPKHERKQVVQLQPENHSQVLSPVATPQVNDHDTVRPAIETGANLIEEAEGLKETLRGVSIQTARLVAALRQQRKQSKLVASTLATLRQIQQLKR